MWPFNIFKKKVNPAPEIVQKAKVSGNNNVSIQSARSTYVGSSSRESYRSRANDDDGVETMMNIAIASSIMSSYDSAPASSPSSSCDDSSSRYDYGSSSSSSSCDYSSSSSSSYDSGSSSSSSSSFD